MSGLALTYASTGHPGAAEKGRYLVAELGRCQSRARGAGFHDGYLSAFPESFFDRLEAGLPVWSPYYMIHKIMAGLIDQHELAGQRPGPGTGGPAGRLGELAHRPGCPTRICSGSWKSSMAASPSRWPTCTGSPGTRRTCARPSASTTPASSTRWPRGQDQLRGLHANTNIPKMIACLRIWEETGDERYHAIAANFWRIVTRHHSYVIGGTSNYEHWHAPDVIAGQLTNRTCENCCSYNMLKLTRLLHFHQPHRIDLLDYYERTLFNQMLGEQDPRSPHGFNIYYTGLSPGAFKQQPPFMGTRSRRVLHGLSQFLLRRRHRHGDPGQVRRHHLLPRPGRALRQPVHPVRGDLAGQGG